MFLYAHTLAGVFGLGSADTMVLLRAARAGKSGKEHISPERRGDTGSWDLT